mmetsp:Transcript_21292/g.18159  ORF Transcript_21292/g.18159 Transcript_21292/m.18159 type:complete len:230 (+) Transcript_21292:200-889(+)
MYFLSFFAISTDITNQRFISINTVRQNSYINHCRMNRCRVYTSTGVARCRRGLLSMSDITTCTLRPNGLSAVGVVYHDGISGYAIGSHDPICSELMTSLLRKGRKPIEVEQSLPVELIYAVRPVILCAAEEVSLNGDQVIQRIPTSLKEEIYDLANLFGTGRDRKSLAQLIDLLLLRGDVQPTEMARMRLGCEISKWLEEKNLTRRFPVLNEYSKKCRIGDGTFGFVEM